MDQPLSLGADFFKAHGHGNDYLVFQEGRNWLVTPETVQSVCHRYRGPGGDGIVVLLSSRTQEGGVNHPADGTGRAPVDSKGFSLRMFNPDGSEFERSGNGLRILGAFLFSEGRVGIGRPFPVEVGGETVEMEILEELERGGLDVAVEMGQAGFGARAVNADPAILSPDSTLPGINGAPMEVHPVSIGNPHCVIFREALHEGDLLELGPFLTSHRAFPDGTNVQLAEVKGEGEVEILIWERGVGRTASSGTSACAVAAASVHSGRVSPGKIRIGMEGGSFQVSVTPEMSVRLQGPVRPVLTGRLRPEFLDGLRAGMG